MADEEKEQFEQLSGEPQTGEEGKELSHELPSDEQMDLIMDIPVTISVEIGRTKINIRNLLQLSQGAIVELDRLSGEPLDVFVNKTLVAHGEVIVVNDKFGIRLTDVISKQERLKRLAEEQ